MRCGFHASSELNEMHALLQPWTEGRRDAPATCLFLAPFPPRHGPLLRAAACGAHLRGAAPRPGARFSTMRMAAALLLALALLAAAPRSARAACNTTLALPAAAGSLTAAEATEGWCSPFAIVTPGDTALCANLTVPAGGVLEFGTCALPGAACSGATALELQSAGGSTLASFGRVSLNSSVARLSQGCVLGVRCSYGEFRNMALAPLPVAVRQRCYGASACAGVTAWRVSQTANGALLPALQPTATDALLFTAAVTAAQPLALLALSGDAPTGATVQVWTLTSAAAITAGAATAALATSSGWTLRWSGTWSGGGASFGTPLLIPAGGAAALLVRVLLPGSGDALPCAHVLGTAGASLLISDALLSVSQGGAVSSPLAPAAAVVSACAWRGLALTYTVPGVACAPPPPPPAPAIATSEPTTLAASLDDLLRALADPAVALVEVNAYITLNGTQLGVALPVAGFRALTVEGTNACWDTASSARVACALDAGGLSRIFQVGPGVQLRLAHLTLANGAAPPGGYGGCVLAENAAPLRLDDVTFDNCSAPQGGGGAAVLGGDLAAVSASFEACTAEIGGGLLAHSGSIALTSCAFRGNEARALARTVDTNLGGPAGAAGGGAAMFNVTGAILSSEFSGNAATTIDMVLLANPDAQGQARGGGLYASDAALRVSGCTFSRNAAGFGGAVNAHGATLALQGCALADNIATPGFGGGLFVRDCPAVGVSASLLAGNAAGGRTGGGIAAFNSSLHVSGCVLRNNAAPSGCGGALGLDDNAALLLDGGSVLANNTAHDGGGACCELCAQMALQDSFLVDNAAHTGAGGALYSGASPTVLSNVTLRGNAAPSGGAIAAVAAPLSLADCVLEHNSALDTHGGAVLHDASDDPVGAPLALLRCRLSSNVAAAGGGALAALAAATVSLDGCSFVGNAAAGGAAAGGALWALDVVSLGISGCVFSSNSVTLVAETRSQLGYGSAPVAAASGAGGAAWLGANLGNCTAVVVGSTFADCSAPSGGGIFATGGVTLAARSCAFLNCVAAGYAAVGGDEGVGGGLATDEAAAAALSDTSFVACSAVRGGGAWHGGASRAAYARCTFDANFGSPSADGSIGMGSALHVDEAARVTVAGSLFSRNLGRAGVTDGTVALAGDHETRLTLSDSVFDGNAANLGGCLFITCASQPAQLAVSGVVFRNNYAFLAASLLYTEAPVYAQLACAPVACDGTVNNTAALSRQTQATPPVTLDVNITSSLRSGAVLPVSVTLYDGFAQKVRDWRDTTATIETTAAVSGLLRTFYAHGAATFTGLTLKGAEGASYNLTLTVSGPGLFGTGSDARSVTRAVTVQPCQPDEAFDPVRQLCACATGFGLVVESSTCERCSVDAVVPVAGGSCITCPALSKPAGLFACVCNPGYFGTIEGATGGCTQCPADTFRSATDPPGACVDCPPTSHTFALGATSANDCLCGSNAYGDRTGGNGTFSCSPVPLGGWSRQGDSRLLATAGYWRPNGQYTHFFPCADGMCDEEQPAADANASALGYACRPGHAGHLCAVCQPGWAYQGIYCQPCKPGATYDEWSSAMRGGILFTGLFCLFLLTFSLFFLPLCPRLEAALERAWKPAAARIEAALQAMSPRRSQIGGASRPTSAARRMSSAASRPASATVRRRSSARLGLGGVDPHAPSPVARRRARPQSKLGALAEVLAEPARIVISFWQIVSSFNNSLAVPWPAVYRNMTSALSVVSLQLLKLPTMACISPEVSFFTIFDGTTTAMLLYLLFGAGTLFFGRRAAVLRSDPQRKLRFTARAINAFIWGLFLAFPQVASTTLLVFSCAPLENGTSWLTADYRIQCWTRTHWAHVGAGVFWTILFPVGIPIAFLFTLSRAGVPQLAAWKRDCAWLRAIVQRARLLGFKPSLAHPHDDPDTLTTESIAMEHLKALHELFVISDPAVAPAQRKSLLMLLPAADAAVSAHVPDPPTVPRAPAAAAAPLPAGGSARPRRVLSRLLSRLPRKRRALIEAATTRVLNWAQGLPRKTKVTLSRMLWRDERELLLRQLLGWARMDESGAVAEPRDNQLRWRTPHEWEGLAADNATLGPHDATERDAFRLFRFLFAGFAPRAWWWESMDLMQKLFFTSITPFIAPGSSVQIIVAALFALGMLLLTLHVQPYCDEASNELAALSQINVFLFLFCGLLLKADPDGIARNRLLFSVCVGFLTTSIVGLSFLQFIRSLYRQTLRALYGLYDEDEDEDDYCSDDEEAPPLLGVAETAEEVPPPDADAPSPPAAEADEKAAPAAPEAGAADAAEPSAKSSGKLPPLSLPRQGSPPRGQALMAHALVSGAGTPPADPADSNWK